jgi:hypothetical protein
MNKTQYLFRNPSAILLVGICSCLPEEHDELIEDQIDAFDVSEPTEISTAETSEQSNEIQWNGAGTSPKFANQLKVNFDQDNFADLVIGAPADEIPGGGPAAGTVRVIFGSLTGLDDGTEQLLSFGGDPDEEFGSALAVGDFDGDTIPELAVGIPISDVAGQANAGSVAVYPFFGPNPFVGSSSFGPPTFLDQSSVPGESIEPDDQFGFALAVGDFNSDGKDDLAVGVPFENHSSSTNAGLVHVFLGSNLGLGFTTPITIHQDTANVSGNAESNDLFGSALAAGNFGQDPSDDLAIGVPGDEVDGRNSAGSVNVLYGDVGTGLSVNNEQRWHQNSGLEGESESGDEFGSALAVGDFDSDGRDDLAVGVPNENVGSTRNAGAVNTIYGSNSGLTTSGNEYWNQNTSDVKDTAQEDDNFGYALAAGNFDGDAEDDLAIGVPGETFSSFSEAGLVNVLYGSGSGLSASRDDVWNQDSSNIDGAPHDNERFGSSLSIGDFDGSGEADLAIGVPFDEENSNDAGAVNVIYGSGSGLTSSGDQRLREDGASLSGTPQSGDQLGFAVR